MYGAHYPPVPFCDVRSEKNLFPNPFHAHPTQSQVFEGARRTRNAARRARWKTRKKAECCAKGRRQRGECKRNERKRCAKFGCAVVSSARSCLDRSPERGPERRQVPKKKSQKARKPEKIKHERCARGRNVESALPSDSISSGRIHPSASQTPEYGLRSFPSSSSPGRCCCCCCWRYGLLGERVGTLLACPCAWGGGDHCCGG